ncbi:hypothetical protein [Anaerostipes sp. MSJ-23]|nr:hypothetical protein [Anaerostipes sp. MSJ-23]
MTAFVSELVSYLIKFIFLLAVAGGGTLIGSHLSQKKNKEQA